MTPDNSRNLADLDSRLTPLCEAFLVRCKAAGLSIIVSQTYRSTAYQNQLYAKGRTTPGPKVTNARGGGSAHNVTKNGTPASRAFDIAIESAPGVLNWNAASLPWKTAGAIGIELGLDWGGAWTKFKDAPHFQLKNWRGLA